MNKKIIFCLIVMSLLTTAASATIHVPTNYATIEAAISAVPLGGPETIIVDDGTYTPPTSDGYDFAGKDITLQSLNGPANCIIDCQNNGRAFYFHTGETPNFADVNGFTIKNGNEYYGGAIEFEDASATIDNCIITNCTAVYGGAIDCFYASPVIKNCIITNNTSNYDGGAIECSSESSPDITNCLITDNNSINGYGGAIDCYDISAPQIVNCTIANNTGSSNYGGVYADGTSNPTIRNSILWNNGDDIAGTINVTYSCIQDGDAGTGNISSDPLFRTGPYPSYGDYYLSQIAAGQLADSNCVNTGDSSYAAIYDALIFTTRTNNTVDSGTVDMGFHYPDSGINNIYTLTTAVDPNGNPGAILPASGPYAQFTEVLLTATPDEPNDYIEKWNIDGNDVNDTNSTIIITMDANHAAAVMFSSSVCKLITYVYGANGTIVPAYPPDGNSFPKNSQVTINAYPSDPNVYGVNRWFKGASATFDIGNPLTYTVTYGPNTIYTVTLDVNTTVAVEFGRYMLDPRVELMGDGQKHGTLIPDKGYQPARKTVTLTATPEYGYTVDKWTGTDNDGSTAPTNTVTMTSSKIVKVKFKALPQYTLTTTAAAGATITPYYPAGQSIVAGTIVDLTATIPAGTVIDWSGTDNNNTFSLTNTVTMDANHTVNVSYHTPRVLHVPGQYSYIQDAIDAAANGDRIIVAQRAGNPYTINRNFGHEEEGFDLGGKRIRISSENPDDPCCVAATIIDCEQAGRAFILQNNETRDTVIEGLTIINGSPMEQYPQAAWENEGTGSSNGNDANGGAIFCTNNASPTISNCVFKNCRAEGERGGNSIHVYDDPPSPPDNTGAAGLKGNDGIAGGAGGHGLGGALYFNANSSPRILNCKIIDCRAIGGNGGTGGNGQNGQDGASGLPPDGNGGKGGNGGAGGNGGIGGNGRGGAIYFAGNNNAIIEYCTISDCYVKPGLGNSAGNGANGGTGGSGAGTGNGANGGDGGNGGNGGTNGTVTAGAIYSGNNCNIQISDTTFSNNYTSIDVESFRYHPGSGGDGGDGGGGTIDGNGGKGGNGGQAGNAGDNIYIGDGADGGDGGGGRNGGNGGDGSAGFREGTDGLGGEGGDGGDGGTNGTDGCDGCIGWLYHYMWNEAGCNRYGVNCTVNLTNCNFLENYTAGDDGGAEYYEGLATAAMNNCTFTENSSASGGAQFFGWIPNNNIDINDCTYNRNNAWYWHGGAVFAGWNVNLTVKNSTFADNVSLGSPGYGGGIHWDNLGYSGKTVSVTDSYFINNTAGFGGGLHWKDDTSNLNTTTVTNCLFTKNYSDHGAGLYWSEGSPTISGCIFTENQANGRWVWLDNWAYGDFFGGGGGIFSFSSNGTIKDCTFTDNTTSGSGGGIYAGGGAENLKIHNCLITNNSAVMDGGGISLNWFVTSQITNCTIAENTANDPTDTTHGYGGGVSCTYESNTTMFDSILWDNNAPYGNQISLGSSSDPVYLQKPAELTISYSDIQNWNDTNGIYIHPDRIISIDANNVIDDDPCFVSTYFLNTTPVSPCVNAGSNLASVIGLDTYTTRTDNIPDAGTVDMGYHYALNELTIIIIGNGTVTVNPNNYDPNSGTYFGSILGLTAIPDAGYRVKSWTGADISPAWNTNTNTVTMTSDKTVTVEFEISYNRTLRVPGDFAGIQDAINAAKSGDTIQLSPGTYVGTGFIVDRKNITILGNPAHPDTVVIDCQGESTPVYLRPKGFVLIGDNYYSTTLNGLSIINSNTVMLSPTQPDEWGEDGRPTKTEHDLDDARGHYGGAITIQGHHTVKNCIIRDCSLTVNQATDGVAGGNPVLDIDNNYNGGDGGYGGNAGGAGIYVVWGNAKITNITVENCRAYAGNAGNGAPGFENTEDNYPPGESGNGGDGGSAAGAGIYVRSGNPIFTNVTVRNSIARAGNGGNGATGAEGADGGDGGLPGRVKGAGVYCAVTSAPTFVSCTIENNRGYGGRGGNGGDGGTYIVDEPETEGGYGGLTTEAAAGQGDIRMYSTNGGAVFCDNKSRAAFTDCTFADNMTYGSISGIGGLWHLPADWREQPKQNYRVPSLGAGVFCSTESSTNFTGCLFENNRTAYNQDYSDPNYLAAVGLTDINDYDGEHTGVGGGLCLWSATSATVSDCNFVLNSAPIGGGIYSSLSGLYISGSTLTNNVAYTGGGVMAVDSTATVNNSQFKGNVAGTVSGYYSDLDTGYALFGTGGGIYALDTQINISDTTITENYARFTGGGVCFDGDTPVVGGTVMKNCLVTENRTAEGGGGIASIYFAEPIIQNCTIVDNYVTNTNGSGGGIFCSLASEAIVKDTILWSNSGINGSQIALSDGGPFMDMPASLDISYSDMQNSGPNTAAIDIVICIDTTGSMNNVLDSMKEAASDIVDKVAEKTTDYRIAVVDFKDFNTAPYGSGTDYPFRDDAEFTSYKDIIQTAINGLESSGGGDWEESVYSALMHSIDGNSLGGWRSDASVNKIIILMGDAPPHDPEPNTAYTLGTVTKATNDKDISIFSILTGYGVGNMTVTSFFQNLASDTGGVLIESPDGSTAADAVMQAIDLATTPPEFIYIEGDSTITGFEQDANDNWFISTGSNNITEDPNFVCGYYLSHIAAGQDVDSVCINAGSDTAIALGLDTYTTRVDGIFDTSIVDIGYHYKYGVPQYDITVRILDDDTNDPGIHGYITSDPNNLVSFDANTTTYKFSFYEGEVPTFTATADANHFVKGWYDKNDATVSNSNTLILTVEADAEYSVRFTGGRTVSVSGGGDELRDAVKKAENHDILVVSAGTYFGDIDLLGKQIKLYGTKPDDPNVIERTIIDCSGSSGFIFSGGETADTVLSGFTIINGGGTDIRGGGIFINENSSPFIANVDINDCNALSGGGIYISSSSNPRFEKVNIANCSATASGGGVYIGTESSPIFEDCLIANCNAGTNGGAAYCNTESSPFFTNCSFSGNNAADSGGGIFYGTSCDVNIKNCTFTDNSADYDAGAIMCGRSCAIDIDGCEITDSSAGNSGGGIFIDKYSYGRIRGGTHNRMTLTGNSASQDGGAIFITDSDAIDIGYCNIIFNTALRGGGIYALESPEVIIYDCSIHSNKASQDGSTVGQGGGIYAFTSIEQIANCKIRDNYAETSGGGIYIAGKQNTANRPIVFNCLITENTANRDGGGISSNWLAEPLIRNCTFYHNGAILSSNSYGGGLSCAYQADTQVINSIFWNNSATYGRAISIGSKFDAANKLSAKVTVSYSDVRDGQAGVFIDTASGCTLSWGAGNFAGTTLDSPLFVEGSFGNFYLAQTATGDANQTLDSPCVDAGLGTAIDNDMYKHTTRTDHVLDIADSSVDMGYHYTLTADILGDFNFDGIVDVQDLYLFTLYWLGSDCDAPFFCHERDLNEDGQVDFEDFAMFAANYGLIETVPPQPDPMTWKKVPRAIEPNSITMTATKAVDYSGSPIEYYFDCVDCNDVADCNVHDSGWLSSSTYIDTGLVDGQRYGYRAKARDGHSNETGWSSSAYATAGEDAWPPEPDPMEWAAGGQPAATSPTSIKMTAKTATDDTPPVQYYFECIEDVNATSGWRTDPNYIATGLTPETQYTFRVKARDSLGYETQYSVSAFATTLAEGTGEYSINITIVGNGSVTKNPDQLTYPYNDSVQLTAAANAGWTFASWSGDANGTNNPATIIVNSDKNITATFTSTADTNAPTYTPTIYGLWVTPPYHYLAGPFYYHTMTAVTATDAQSPPVSYFFECTDGGGSQSSEWQESPSYTAGPFGSTNWSTYRVHIKDAAGNEIVSSKWNTYYGLIE